MNTAAQTSQATLGRQNLHEFAHFCLVSFITTAGFLLAGVCFSWYAQVPQVAILLLALVTFGMSYDFLNHVLGALFPSAERFLLVYSKINFAALCFGIPFTAFAGTFVMGSLLPGSLSAALAENYLVILHASCAFGLLFLFARYKKIDVGGSAEFTLDKSHAYTRTIFIIRRVLLAASLVLALIVLWDAWATELRTWALLFVGIFVASIPLHILHKQIASMWSELLTQGLAMYATWLVFVLPATG